MPLPKGAKQVAREFARSVIRQRWDDIPQLLTLALRGQTTSASLADEFGWENLEPRLQQRHTALTGEEADPDDPLAPPNRYEVFKVDDEVSGEPVRLPPAGHDPAVSVGWVEIDFHPDEESGFDDCYRCFLALIDEHGPKISAYQIESSTE